MEDVKNPDLTKKFAIPSAFSKCANCGISYHESSNPVESVLLVCLHSFCRNCINSGCLRSEKGDQSELRISGYIIIEQCYVTPHAQHISKAAAQHFSSSEPCCCIRCTCCSISYLVLVVLQATTLKFNSSQNCVHIHMNILFLPMLFDSDTIQKFNKLYYSSESNYKTTISFHLVTCKIIQVLAYLIVVV